MLSYHLRYAVSFKVIALKYTTELELVAVVNKRNIKVNISWPKTFIAVHLTIHININGIVLRTFVSRGKYSLCTLTVTC